ncbi:Kelch repeat-containing protein [Cystobacter fuscus]|uniref:Kelch repeat-containing protein n=1 Tax=Cystobacter fuscus TaxID=43 RepID=UPI0037BEB03F
MLTVGGYNRWAEVYDPATGAWSRTADAPNTFRSATATLLLDGQVLIVGAGGSERNRSISAALYNSAVGVWTTTGNMLTPRFHHTATLLKNGQVLITGGTEGEHSRAPLNLAEVYNPATDTWTPTSSMREARRNHTATLLSDGKVLIAGGTVGGEPLGSAEIYDPDTGTWSPVGAMTVARAYHSATLLPDGRVLVTGGGGTDRGSSASTELFTPAHGTWATAASMTQPRRKHSATLLSMGKVLVAGGLHELTGIQTAAEAYDPTSDTWSSAGNMKIDRYQHTATLLSNGQMLVAGGISNTDQASAELLNPYFLEDDCKDLGLTECTADLIGYVNTLVRHINAITAPLESRTTADMTPCPAETGAGELIPNIFTYVGPLDKSCNRIVNDDCSAPLRGNYWVSIVDDRRSPGSTSFRVIWGGAPGNYTYYGACYADPNGYDNVTAGIPKLLRPVSDENGDGIISGCVENHVYQISFYTFDAAGVKTYIQKNNIKEVSGPFLVDPMISIPDAPSTSYTDHFKSGYVAVGLKLKNPADQIIVAHVENNYNGTPYIKWKEANSCTP